MTTNKRGIMQDWTTGLGLRHQGVLLAAVRGCDTAPKEAASKTLTRFLRGAILTPHCGDLSRVQAFMQAPRDQADFDTWVTLFMAEKDMLPTHYVMHLMHAGEILGYYHPDVATQVMWGDFYERMVRKLHLQPESREALDHRLNKDEDGFGAEQREDQPAPSKPAGRHLRLLGKEGEPGYVYEPMGE